MAPHEAPAHATPAPLRAVIGTGSREARAGLVATASTISELKTYCRSFRPDAVIVAEDLALEAAFEEALAALEETLVGSRIVIVGPSAPSFATSPNIMAVGASSDILDTLFSPTSRPVSPGSPESPG